MQWENLTPQRNIENTYKQTDERYQKQLSGEKESDERDQISKNDEEKIIEDIKILKLQNLRSQRKMYISWERIWWNNSEGYSWQQGLWWKRLDK